MKQYKGCDYFEQRFFNFPMLISMRQGSELTCFDVHYQRLDLLQVGLKTKEAFGSVTSEQLAIWRLKQVQKKSLISS